MFIYGCLWDAYGRYSCFSIVHVIFQASCWGGQLVIPRPARNCAINIMNVISSFSWISHFSFRAQRFCQCFCGSNFRAPPFNQWWRTLRVQAVDDCATLGSQEARCGAEISALIAALMMSPAAGYATTSAPWPPCYLCCIWCHWWFFQSSNPRDLDIQWWTRKWGNVCQPSEDCAKNPDPKYELLHEPTPWIEATRFCAAWEMVWVGKFLNTILVG